MALEEILALRVPKERGMLPQAGPLGEAPSEWAVKIQVKAGIYLTGLSLERNRHGGAAYLSNLWIRELRESCEYGLRVTWCPVQDD